MNKTTGRGLLVLLAAMALAGCDLFQPKPENAAVTVVPPPPASGPVDAYADAAGIGLQSRPGNCANKDCYQFTRGKWRVMPRVDVTTLPLLSVADATGSVYSDALWHRVSNSGNAVLINRQAGAFNLSEGRLDGLRIGLKQDTRLSYVVAYSVETGEFLKAHNQCIEGQGVISSGPFAKACTRKIAADLYAVVPDAQVIAANGKAWLLHRRADGSANLIDLYGASAQADKHLCIPGLLLDSAPAGDYAAALSPDMFVSRAIHPSAGNAAALSCFATKPKP